MTFDPKKSVRKATQAMNSYTRKHSQGERPLELSTNTLPVPCAVLLKSFTDNGPVPPDFVALPRTSAALKAHVRPDGAIYKGAYQVQGDPDSVVLMYGPKNLTEKRAAEIANLERLALKRRHEAKQLGQFARNPDLPSRADRPSAS